MPTPIPASWLRAMVAMAKPSAACSVIASQPRSNFSGRLPSVAESPTPPAPRAAPARALERAPRPFRAGDRGAVDHRQQPAQAKDERQDGGVGLRELEDGQGLPAAGLPPDLVGGRTDRQED